MRGTHIFFVMLAKARTGGNQFCAGGPGPTHAPETGARRRRQGRVTICMALTTNAYRTV
jgi:hypothetical protein